MPELSDLNRFMQPIDSPINNRPFISTYKYDSTNDRGVVRSIYIQDAAISNAKLGTAIIGTANIGTLTFNEISGGTATFGGTANGDGLVEVLNEGGGTVVTMDKDGLTVTDGSISIENASGTTFIDDKGLVSDAVFDFSGTTSALNSRETSSGTFVAVANTSVTIVTERSNTNILTMGGGNFAPKNILAGNTETTYVAFNIDGTILPHNLHGFAAVSNTFFGTPPTWTFDFKSFQHISSVGAGTHTIRMDWKNISGGTSAVNTTFLNCLVLGN